MPRKCSVFGCHSKYKHSVPDKSVSTYRFPKDPDMRKAWVTALPNAGLTVDQITVNMTVCSRHFASTVRTYSKLKIPIDPPTIFEDVPDDKKSCIPTPGPKPRPTKMTSWVDRTEPADPDIEFKKFKESEKLKEEEFSAKLMQLLITYSCCLVWSADNTQFSLLSDQRHGPVFNFAIHFRKLEIVDGCIRKLAYEAYVGLKRITPACLPRYELTCWDQIAILLKAACEPSPCDPTPEELQITEKTNFLLRQITLLNTAKNLLVYNSSDLLQAFSWYTISRPMYSMLRDSLILPSISTLRKLTRVAKNLDDDTLFSKILANQEDRSKGVAVLFDEVYVKEAHSYSGEWPYKIKLLFVIV